MDRSIQFDKVIVKYPQPSITSRTQQSTNFTSSVIMIDHQLSFTPTNGTSLPLECKKSVIHVFCKIVLLQLITTLGFETFLWSLFSSTVAATKVALIVA